MSSVYHDSISTIINAVRAALSEQPVLRGISAAKQTSFALDLALIALGCRCAWLVDVTVVADAEQVYDSLLRTLRQFPICSNPRPNNPFFVNKTKWRASVDEVHFVHLGRDPQLLPRPPLDVLAALQALTYNPPTLPPGLEPHTIIPLAGVLLGYPVAYVPDADGAFLAQASLDVFACSVRAPTWEHPFLKFSCPAVLAATHPELAPTRIAASLKTRFEPRLQELGLGLVVKHSTEIVDRVAL
ncbi:Thioredoxin-domain-containing protein [Mycena sanguinolenta]|uniref:Thioredoxin-domain-containing protein n=1 Tax=Mycena sanguinolenta TaxID=230812 RepID=A0A8H6XTZ0_9AGAR|nr:Thioredoxin-domain-containing protein [Mycena sanguinolenta]